MRLRNKLRNAFEEADAIKDKEIKAQNTLRVDYYRGYLWRLFLGSVRVVVPAHWSIDYFRFNLLYGGMIGVTKYRGVVVPFQYTIDSRNRWKYPVIVRSSDDVQLGTRHVGNDCEIIYTESASFGDLFSVGISSLIDIYAQKLANCDGAIDINLLVSRTPWLFGVENNNQAQDMKALFTKVMSGVPAVYYKTTKKDASPIDRNELPLTRLPVKENFVANDIQLTKHEIVCEFLTAIGVNNANTDKRERLITDEVNANNEQLAAAVDLWQSNVDRQIKKVKELYGSELDGELSVSFGMGGCYGRTDRFNGNVQNNGEESIEP